MAVGVAAVVVTASPASAQQAAEGFAVNRLYASAPGAGWIVMDALDMRGGLGGAMAVSLAYDRGSFRMSDGASQVRVVDREVFTTFGLAMTYDRWRIHLDLQMPWMTQGADGTMGGYRFAAPAVDLGSHPDTLVDPRLGAEVRLYGDAHGPVRLGLGAQLFAPNGRRADYASDGTYRAMFRALMAGDSGPLSYAAHLGVHVRPLDDSPVPGTPRGSEQSFGVAAGLRVPLGDSGEYSLVAGPELFGQTAFSSFLRTETTGLEGLLSAWLDRSDDSGGQLRAKFGIGPGIHPHFGTPEWRAVLSVELVGRTTPSPSPFQGGAKTGEQGTAKPEG